MGWFTGKSKEEKEEDKKIYAKHTNGDVVKMEDEKSEKKITCVGNLTFEKSISKVYIQSGQFNGNADRSYDGHSLTAVYATKVNIEGISKTFSINGRVHLNTYEKESQLYKVVGTVIEEGISDYIMAQIKSSIVNNLTEEIELTKVTKGKEFMDSIESLNLNFDIQTDSKSRSFNTILEYKE